MELVKRARAAARILIHGDSRKNKRGDIPAISAREVAEIRQFFPREKFFILGHARSGTTLLMRLVRLHPEVHCNYQAHFFTRPPLLKSLVNTPEIEEWLTRKSNRWNEGGDLSALVLRAAADVILERGAARAGKRIVGDKSPASAIHGQAVRDMHAIYPDAKLIYIVRDGRDVVVSERFRNFVEESKFLTAQDKRILSDLQTDPASYADGSRSIFSPAFLRRVTSSWAANLKETEEEGRRLFRKNFLGLRYEDLLQNPQKELERVWKFLGARKASGPLEKKIKAEISSNPDEEWQARRNEAIASFLAKGHSGNWRRLFTDGDKELFKQVAGETLVQWKYESDLNW